MERHWCQAGKNHVWIRQDWAIQVCCSVSGDPSEHRLQIENPKHLFEVLSKEWPDRFSQLETGPLPNGLCRICIDEEKMQEFYRNYGYEPDEQSSSTLFKFLHHSPEYKTQQDFITEYKVPCKKVKIRNKLKINTTI